MLPSRLVRVFINKSSRFTLLKTDNFRAISTSKKNSEATAAGAATDCKIPTSTKPWQSYGFSHENQKEDVALMHLMFFFGVTMCIVWTGFVVAYAPSHRGWEQREAFLELRRREHLGLPLIDPNYIDPSLVELPSDEELGDAEIII